MVVQVQELKSFSNCQNNQEPILLSFNVWYRWKLLLSSLAFICESYCQESRPNFRIEVKPLTKQNSCHWVRRVLFMREVKENRLFCFFNYLDLLKMKITLILGKKRLENWIMVRTCTLPVPPINLWTCSRKTLIRQGNLACRYTVAMGTSGHKFLLSTWAPIFLEGSLGMEWAWESSSLWVTQNCVAA